jgi:hypothetical protein
MRGAGDWQCNVSSLADPKEKLNMKRSLRALLLLVGLVGTLAFAAVPKTTPQSGPVPLCDPWHNPNCSF